MNREVDSSLTSPPGFTPYPLPPSSGRTDNGQPSSLTGAATVEQVGSEEKIYNARLELDSVRAIENELMELETKNARLSHAIEKPSHNPQNVTPTSQLPPGGNHNMFYRVLFHLTTDLLQELGHRTKPILFHQMSK